MVEDRDGVVKVRFQLDQDAEGWPPVGSEGVWAEPLGEDQYRVRNTPWFVLNLASEDVVVALADSDGVLWATGERIWSGRMTVRVIPFRAGPLGGDRQAVLDAFEPLGVTGEGTEEWGIVALDIPPDADLVAVKRELRAGQVDGRSDSSDVSPRRAECPLVAPDATSSPDADCSRADRQFWRSPRGAKIEAKVNAEDSNASEKTRVEHDPALTVLRCEPSEELDGAAAIG